MKMDRILNSLLAEQGRGMRRPTSREVAYAWHENALRGIYGDEVVLHGEEPECGWFKRRLAKSGIYVPARIWLYQEIDEETGELLSDELMQCEVAGEYRDPEDEWPWLCGRPISEAEFNYMTARNDWARLNAPADPAANPRQKVDWAKVPIPTFSRKEQPHE